jgi:hypothetical protein
MLTGVHASLVFTLHRTYLRASAIKRLLLMITFIPNLERIELLELLGCLTEHYPFFTAPLWRARMDEVDGSNAKAFLAGKIIEGRRQTRVSRLYTGWSASTCALSICYIAALQDGSLPCQHMWAKAVKCPKG